MNTEKLIQFFTTKLEKISELRNLNDYDNPTFTAWWNTATSTCERMGESYKRRTDHIHFFPSVIVGGGNDALYSRAYQSGLNDAEAFIKSVIEELETWGYGEDGSKNNGASKQPAADSKVVLNLTISQQQAQDVFS